MRVLISLNLRNNRAASRFVFSCLHGCEQKERELIALCVSIVSVVLLMSVNSRSFIFLRLVRGVDSMSFVNND